MLSFGLNIAGNWRGDALGGCPGIAVSDNLFIYVDNLIIRNLSWAASKKG